VNVPVTFVVMYWDVVLQDPGNPIGIGVGILTFCTTTILLWSYRLYLRPLATWAPQPFVSEAADIR
jgi:hypothetical protein